MYGIDTSNWGLIFIVLCSDKLPASTVTLWEQTLADKTITPKRSHLNDSLYERFRTFELVSENRIYNSLASKMDKSQNCPTLKINPIKVISNESKSS